MAKKTTYNIDLTVQEMEHTSASEAAASKATSKSSPEKNNKTTNESSKPVASADKHPSPDKAKGQKPAEDVRSESPPAAVEVLETKKEKSDKKDKKKDKKKKKNKGKDSGSSSSSSSSSDDEHEYGKDAMRAWRQVACRNAAHVHVTSLKWRDLN